MQVQNSDLNYRSAVFCHSLMKVAESCRNVWITCEILASANELGLCQTYLATQDCSNKTNMASYSNVWRVGAKPSFRTFSQENPAEDTLRIALSH